MRVGRHIIHHWIGNYNRKNFYFKRFFKKFLFWKTELGNTFFTQQAHFRRRFELEYESRANILYIVGSRISRGTTFVPNFIPKNVYFAKQSRKTDELSSIILFFSRQPTQKYECRLNIIYIVGSRISRATISVSSQKFLQKCIFGEIIPKNIKKQILDICHNVGLG